MNAPHLFLSFARFLSQGSNPPDERHLLFLYNLNTLIIYHKEIYT